ncbi:MAG: pentapeptide repeat-containing protein [Albidovulum sp.]
MPLLEDMLSADDIAAVERVLASDNPRFDLLVKAAGLNPQSDLTFSDLRRLNLSGADLRGFNFSGSDLRDSVRNEHTLIDETTIFGDAKIAWIEIEALPIVEKMQEVERASNSDSRQKMLIELTTEFGKTRHVVSYMTIAASEANSLDAFLDFALFLPNDLTEEQAGKLRVAAKKLLAKKFGKSASRTRRQGTTIFAADSIVEKLQRAPGSLAERIYDNLAKIVLSKHETVTLKGVAHIQRTDIEAAFSRIGR